MHEPFVIGLGAELLILKYLSIYEAQSEGL